MGSHLGPFLSDAFMDKLEKYALRPYGQELNFYSRYVDDICHITENNATLESSSTSENKKQKRPDSISLRLSSNLRTMNHLVEQYSPKGHG